MMDILIRILADGLVIPIVLLGLWALLMIPNDEKYKAYGRVLMAGLTAYAAAKIIGAFYQPEVMRPFEKMGIEAGASSLNNPGFPSDHALFCMAITLAVWFEAKRKRLAVTLFCLSILVGLGRILGLVHTPLDVVGGTLIACAGIPWYIFGSRVQARAVTKQSRAKRKNSVK